MDHEVAELARVLRELIDEVVGEEHRDEGDGGGFVAAVREHLGADPRALPVVAERVASPRLPDVDIALDVLGAEGGGHRVLGSTGGRVREDLDLGELLRGEGGRLDVGPVAYANVPVGPGAERQVVTWGLHLFAFAGSPVAVLQRSGDEDMGRGPVMEVLAPTPDVAAALLHRVRAAMVEHSVLRGQVMSFAGDEYESTLGGITFHERPAVAEGDVVLPAGTLARLVRHVVGVGERRDRMLAAGQHLKRGILLYGPPGTGKTLTVRHLLARTPGTTAVLLSGRSLGWVREATNIARAMQPGLVVLEDCDLIAEDRDAGSDSMLFELLDALDGLGADADVTFLLTTNRPDLLERALVERPGRVDLAVEVPLPDLAARTALFRLYARDLPLSGAALDAAAARAEGVTASFAKELVRRAVLAAALEDRLVTDADLSAALEELLSDAESLTRSLLGSGPAVALVEVEDAWDDEEEDDEEDEDGDWDDGPVHRS